MPETVADIYSRLDTHQCYSNRLTHFLCISFYLLLGFFAARMAAIAMTQGSGKTGSGRPSLNGSASAGSDDSCSPGTPIEEYKPLTAPLTLDYSSKVCAKAHQRSTLYCSRTLRYSDGRLE